MIGKLYLELSENCKQKPSMLIKLNCFMLGSFTTSNTIY